jgi:hypothetical protein
MPLDRYRRQGGCFDPPGRLLASYSGFFVRRAMSMALSLADGGNSASGCKSSAWRSGSPHDHLIE